jgi:mannose-6-phosphate isomerase-like protein (cupin superfamily)
MQQTGVRVIKAGEGRLGFLGGLGVRFMVPGEDTGGGFSLVEHPMRPRALAAPLHRHSREDEYSFVLEGRVGALLGDDVVFGEPGDLIYKPRGQWHTFWNAADEDASLLEIISPAGFEKYFEELTDLVKSGRPEPGQIAPIAARYGLELDPSSIPSLCARFGVTF